MKDLEEVPDSGETRDAPPDRPEYRFDPDPEGPLSYVRITAARDDNSRGIVGAFYRTDHGEVGFVASPGAGDSVGLFLQQLQTAEDPQAVWDYWQGRETQAAAAGEIEQATSVVELRDRLRPMRPDQAAATGP